MTKTLGEKSLVALTWVFIDKLAGSSFNFLVTIILARLLSPEDFGLIARVGAEFMRKLALEEDGKDTGDAFRPREEPEEPEEPESDETDETDETDDVEEIVVAQQPDENQEQINPEDGVDDDGDLSDETS